jgi:4-amino-4-deoxy-L-arabinose transferase-like glycosyltransferase
MPVKIKGISRFAAPGRMIAASFAAAVIGQVFLYYLKFVVPGLVFFAAAAALLVIHDRYEPGKTGIQISKKAEIILFSIIVLIAVLFRLAFIDQIPGGCFRDEAQNGSAAKSIMDTNSYMGEFLPSYITVHTHNPAAFIYIMAAVFKALGVGTVQIRITSAVIGIIAVPAFYFLLRYLMGPASALCGAFLLAVMRWHVNFSRIGFHCIFSVTAVIFALYFISRSYKGRKWSDFILAGLTTALSQYTYLAARLLPVWLVIFGVYIAFKEKGFYAENWKKITAAALTAMLVYLPLGIYSIKQPGNFFTRQEQVFLFDSYNMGMLRGEGKTAFGGFIDACQKTLGMFNIRGDYNGMHNLPYQPMLDFLTGMAALAGFLYAVFSPAKWENILFVSFFAVFAAPGMLTIQSPGALRTILVIPAVVYFAVSYAGKIIEGLKGRPAVLFVSAALFLAAAGAENAYIYFGPQAHSAACRSVFSLNETQMAEYMNRLGPGWRGIVDNDIYLYDSTFYFMAGDKVKNCEIFSLDNPFPAAGPGQEMNTAYVISRGYRPVAETLKDVFPHAEIYQGKDAMTGNEYWFIGLKVPAQDIVNWNAESGRHGLNARYYHGLKWLGKPALAEKKKLIFYEWKAQPVAPPSSAEWTGKIRIDAPGEYVFSAETGDYVSLDIDGRKLIGNFGGLTPVDSGGGEVGRIKLGRGYHSIRLRLSVGKNYSRLSLWWMPPGETEKKLVPPGVLYY